MCCSTTGVSARLTRVNWSFSDPAIESPSASRRTKSILHNVLMLAALPTRRSVFHCEPFVINSCAELIEALDDYQSGKFGGLTRDAASWRWWQTLALLY